MFHWEIKDEINRLKKDGMLEDAINLLLRSIDFQENEAGKTQHRLYPNSFEDAAIIYRKLKLYDDEIAVLERFLSNPKATLELSYTKIVERLEKACLLACKAEKRIIDGVEKIFYIPENILFDERTLFVSNGLIVDVETTGLDPLKDEILELGALLFSYNRKTRLSIGIKETYVGLREPTIPIPASSSRVHGLKIKDVQGKSLDDEKILQLFNNADFLIAHNASFDRKFIQKMYPEIGKKNWYCSMNGIEWKNYGHSSKGLQNLLVDHKIKVENSHRGLDDAIAVYYLLQQMNYSSQKTYLNEILSEYPMNIEDRTPVTITNTNLTYTINVEVSSQKPKKSFWETLFGK